jgi:aspartate aminotransferase
VPKRFGPPDLAHWESKIVDIRLSRRVNAVRPSPTLAVAARAQQLRREGKDIVSLGAGEPDFDTPEYIKEGAIAAIRQGFTKYTAVGGTPELKPPSSTNSRTTTA